MGRSTAIIGFVVLIGPGVAHGQVDGAVQYPPLSIGEDAQPPPPAKMVPPPVSPRQVEFGVSGSSLPPSNRLIESNRTRIGCRCSLRLSTAPRLCRPRPAAEVTKVSPDSAGEIELSAAQNFAQRRHVDDPEEEMPYQISYIDTSMSTDEQQTAGRLRTEEFPTEPAALARASELLEGVSYKTVLISEIPTSTWGQPMRR